MQNLSRKKRGRMPVYCDPFRPPSIRTPRGLRAQTLALPSHAQGRKFDEYCKKKSPNRRFFFHFCPVPQTNGAMYDSQFFVDGTANQQNYFLRSLCRTISYDAAQEADSAKSCSASAYNGVMPYVKCGSVVMDQDSKIVS